jgi:hypothetical protein
MGKLKINPVQISLIVILLVIVGYFAYKKFFTSFKPDNQWDDILKPISTS